MGDVGQVFRDGRNILKFRSVAISRITRSKRTAIKRNQEPSTSSLKLCSATSVPGYLCRLSNFEICLQILANGKCRLTRDFAS
jgi:hypothetical protein